MGSLHQLLPGAASRPVTLSHSPDRVVTARVGVERKRRDETRVSGFRFFKKTGKYRISNCTFDTYTCVALSWDWWQFVRCIDGLVVFNSFRYSNSTSRHQRMTCALLSELGLTIDMEVECPGGLQDLQSGVQLAQTRMAALDAEMQRPRSQARVNARRTQKKAQLANQMADLQSLIKREQYCKEVQS
jgi:hypothetical protein